MKKETALRVGKVLVAALLVAAGIARAEGADQAPEYPQIRPGGTIFADYTYQTEPAGKDQDGNTIQQNSFNVTRAYVSLFASLSRVISARITADLVRDTDVTSPLQGSSVYRLKYAYGQFALDDWVGKGSWLKFGVHQTPYTDFIEGIYRYRFQGQIFTDREGFLSTSDAGISARYAFPSDYGEAVIGGFNGEGYNHSETNDQKAFQVRATVRPAPSGPIVKGLRLTVFWDADHYQGNDPKQRFIATLTFEHPWINAGFESLDATDRPTSAAPEKRARGWSAFATPRTPIGVEGLFRYDSLKPDRDADAKKTRMIAGIAYWFPLQKGIATAVMFDYEQDRYAHFAPSKPTEERWALHTLFSF